MKMKIFESVDNHHMPKSEIVKMFNIPKIILFTINKIRAAIIKAKESNRLLNRLLNNMENILFWRKLLLEG